MLTTENIHPLTDFLRNHKSHIANLKNSKLPEVLTVNGKAEVVIMHSEVYQALANKLEEFLRIEAIQAGIEASDRGEIISSKKARKELKAKNEI